MLPLKMVKMTTLQSSLWHSWSQVCQCCSSPGSIDVLRCHVRGVCPYFRHTN
jgi:hypothetical protein